MRQPRESSWKVNYKLTKPNRNLLTILTLSRRLFEIIQSKLVLDSVITNLNLNEVWGRKYNGGTLLATPKTLEMLKSRMRFAQVRNAKFTAITFYSEDPNEAARVANAIAQAYRDYRINVNKEMMKSGLEILQQQFQEEEKRISSLQTNVEQMRWKYDVQDTASTNQSAKQRLYWNEKRKLDKMTDIHQLLGAKIKAVKIDLNLPNAGLPLVQIMDAATLPKSPVGPNRFVGAVLLALGIFLLVAGFFLIKPSM